MSELPDDAIRVYHGIFNFSGVQIPFSTFLFLIIKYYKVHFSPLGHPRLNKVATFKGLYRNSSSAIDDLKPPAGSYSQHDSRRLSAHVVKLQDIPEEVLILSGLSWVWKSRTRYPVIKGFGGNGTRGGNQDGIFVPPAAEAPSTQDSWGKAIMTKATNASPRGDGHSRSSVGLAPSF
nr:hypothetical protein [Tanacetum cinerariifolium]